MYFVCVCVCLFSGYEFDYDYYREDFYNRYVFSFSIPSHKRMPDLKQSLIILCLRHIP